MKRNLLVLFAALFAVLMCVSAAAMTLDTAELAEETTETEKVIVPGIYVVNGTASVETFEGDTKPSTLTPNAMKSLELSTDKAVSGSQSLKGVGNGNYPKFYIDMPCEEGRKYYIHLSIISDLVSGQEHAFWLMQEGASSNHIFKDYSTGFKTNSPNGNWYTVDDVVTSKTANPFYVQNKGNGATFYYDDIAVIPYYKITYIGLDGETVAATEYVLLDANGDIMKNYIPDLSKVEGATGYALTKGGERIGDVTLNNSDITLYALDTNVVTLSNGNTNVNLTVDGEFTFPAADETFEGIENFICYSDGTSFYMEGDKVAAADVIGKTFTAVCTTYKLFDETYGELIYYTNYDLVGVDTVPGSAVGSGAIIPSYKNNSFIPGDISHTDGNAILTADVTTVDGNRVLKFATRNNNVYNYWCVLMTSEVAGKYIAFEDVRAEDTQGVDLATQFGKGWHRLAYDSTYQTTNYTTKPTADWQTFATSSLVSATGIKYSGYSYNRASKDYLPNIYKDNHAVYCYPSYTIYFKDAADSTEYVKDILDTTEGNPTTYTFPNPEELGYKSENFAKWTNGTKHFAAGEETAIANVQYTVFYPFYQNTDAPAMGFTFEGDKKESASEVGAPKYTENIIDDGRDVLHIHYWNGKSGEGQSFASDTRLSFKTSTRSDPAEYNILQYSLKITNMWNVVGDIKNPTRDEKGNVLYTPVSAQNITVHAHTTAGGVYTNPVITCISKSMSVSDSYSVVEADMSGNANYITKAGYGFCIEPCKATYGYDVYMDYFRVYRKGVQTITYNTNAPEGATVVKEVAADKNRGLGYGYLLKGDKPEVEGYVFLGWGLTADATETVNSITVDGDETVYAVWTKAGSVATPEMADTTEIRGNGENNGIRFKSEIMPSVKENLEEFGFLATREVLLPYADAEKTTRDYTALTFLHKVNGANANYYVQGVAYDKDGDIDVVNGETDDGAIVYTTVLSGIPLEKKEETMVVRSYAKFVVNGKEMVVYGDAASASLYDTAKAIKDENGEAYANNKAYIDEIVG